ncbi:MAG: sulfite exporter TauE/SafE family protein [Actinobacteria bacterium]|nr:sulfite exporter TauE/SafE family protein [Actinomycetota bacterium]
MIGFEIAGLSWPMVVLCTMLAVIGSSVQGSLGFGLGMLTSPLFAMIDPSFIPVAMMLAVVPLTFGVALRDRAHIDASGFKWAILGRFPGVFVGLVALRAMDEDLLAYAVAASVAVAVFISVVTSRRGQVVSANATTLTAAGFASGFMGTVTSIGGPPMALVYKDGDPRSVRATIAAFFSIGVVITVTGFVLSGEIGRHELALTAMILPGVVAGLPLSSVLARHMSTAVMRPLILVMCATSALLLVLQTAL